MHAVEVIEEETKPRPALRDYFVVNGMPYEFTKSEINGYNSIVSELIDKGINPITIEHEIVDDAYVAPKTEQLETTDEYIPPMPPAVQSALADLASKYTDPEVLADFEKVLRNYDVAVGQSQ